MTKSDKCGAQNDFEMPQSLTNVVVAVFYESDGLDGLPNEIELRKAFRQRARVSHPDKVLRRALHAPCIRLQTTKFETATQPCSDRPLAVLDVAYLEM